MAKKNIADKYWIYGEDAELAARLTSYLTRVVYNQRANYIRALMKIKEHECSIEDCDSDIESQSIHPHMFRHTFVSLLMSNPDIGVATVAAEAGHAQPSTTLMIYTQQYKKRRESIRNQLSRELYEK